MTNTHQAFKDDLGPEELERKRAELARLQREIDEDAARLDAAVEEEGPLTGEAVIESWNGREITFIRPFATTMVLFQTKMESDDDAGNQVVAMLGFLKKLLLAEDFRELQVIWNENGDLGQMVEMVQEISGEIASQAIVPDEEQMNRAMRRMEDRLNRQQAKAALEAKGGYKDKQR